MQKKSNSGQKKIIKDELWSDFYLLFTALAPIIQEDAYELIQQEGAKLHQVFLKCAQSEDHELNLLVGMTIA
jgi:hypothetical protein